MIGGGGGSEAAPPPSRAWSCPVPAQRRRVSTSRSAVHGITTAVLPARHLLLSPIPGPVRQARTAARRTVPPLQGHPRAAICLAGKQFGFGLRSAIECGEGWGGRRSIGMWCGSTIPLRWPILPKSNGSSARSPPVHRCRGATH